MEKRRKYGRKATYSGRATVLVCLTAALIFGGVIAACFLLPASEGSPSPASPQESLPNPGGDPSLLEPLAEAAAFYPPDYYENGLEEGSLAYMVNGKIQAEPEAESLPLYLEYPAVNTAYLQIELTAEDSGEPLFRSKIIPPGSLLREIPLSDSLLEGENRLTLLLTALDPDSLEPLGIAEESISVIVSEPSAQQ